MSQPPTSGSEASRLPPSSSLSMADDSARPRFTFVLDRNQPGTRTHAMRAHWQERRRRREESQWQESQLRDRPLRTIRSKSDSSASLLRPEVLVESESAVVSTPSTTASTSDALLTNVQGLALYSHFDAGYTNPLHVGQQQQQHPQQWQHLSLRPQQQIGVPTSSFMQGVPAQLLSGMNHALATSRLDPFESFPVLLTTEHHKLIHHWLTTHATMMFDQITPSDFNPMRDVWFPLDLSNPASFNAIMAHSAAHLAYFYGGTAPTRGTTSLEALKYKSNAVEILNRWVDDQKFALSNETFAAVVRLLTYERYWGTEQEWQIHRSGLQRMIEARGGLHELHDDWRLELVVGLVLLMSQPSWFSPTNNISGISDSTIQTSILGTDIDIKRMRSLWLISFIQDMRNLMSMSSQLYQDGLSMFPALYEAILLIQSNYEMDVHFSSSFSFPTQTAYSSIDYDRLVSLFSICVTVQESVSLSFSSSPTAMYPSQRNALALLDMSLYAAPDTWRSSIHALRSSLHAHFLQFYVTGSQKIDYVMQMTDIVGHLSLEAHRGIEKCLLNMFCKTKNGRIAFAADGDGTPDSLLSSVHGQ